MARVVVSAPLPGRWREILAGHELVAPEEGEAELAPDRLASALADADALLALLKVRVDAALLARAPRLRIVANYAVGYDNVDLAAATARRVVVTNTPGVLTNATADLTLALLLAAARRLREGLSLATSGSWRGWEPEQLVGLELDGAKLGIVGLGRIGRAVAARARGFGMRLVYAAPRPAPPEIERELGIARVSLDALFANSDVVSLHCPLSAETRHFVGAVELARMKPRAILINTARGAIVDEQALTSALERGQLGGVGLDVFEDEPHIPPRLAAIERAFVLPHLGSATERTRAQMAELAAQSITDLLAGRRPAHVVNLDAL